MKNFLFLVFFIFLLAPKNKNEAAKSAGAQEQQRQGSLCDTIYFTIDDGPSPNSFFIDSVVSAEEVPVTVFLVGQNLLSGGDAPYFENKYVKVANHSFSHADERYRRFYRDPSRVVLDFERNALLIHGTNRIARLPGRNTWRIGGRSATDLKDANAAADLLAERSMVIFGWDVEWTYLDNLKAKIESSHTLINRIERARKEQKTFSKHHIVILCHEVMFTTEEARAELICFLRSIKGNQGYEFGSLKYYPGYR